MAVTAADIQGMLSGEFASLSAGTINPFIAEAERQLSISRWDALYDDGVRYLTAHLIATQSLGASAPSGPVTSESAGPLSRSYAAAATWSPDGLDSTVYGRRFLELQRLVGAGFWVL
jgi:hypothetical protein